MDNTVSIDGDTKDKGLLIVNDEETILQFLAIKTDFSNIKKWDYIINPEYNSYESLNRVFHICEAYKDRYDDLEERLVIHNKNYYSVYDTIIVVPGYGKEIEVLIRVNDWNNVILLDKGFNEFVGTSFKHTKINKRAIKYTFNKNLLANENYKEIRDLVVTKDIDREYRELVQKSIERLNAVKDNLDMVLFSSSDIYDLDDRIHDKINHYLEDNYKDKKVAIKRHPRDFVRYNPNNVNVTYIPDDLANALVVADVEKPQTWVYPSSLLIKAKEYIKDIKILNFTHIKDKSYQDALKIMVDNGISLVEV